MLARANILPTEEKAQKLYQNIPALTFMDYWQQKMQEETWKRLSKILGVVWHRDDVQDNDSAPKRRAPDEVFIPLALAIEPNLQEQLKKMFGSNLGIRPPSWVKASEMVNLYDTDRGEFLDFVNTFVRPKVVGK